MEVKAGYKQTNVGLIPEDWEVVNLSTLSKGMQNGVFFKPSRKGRGVKLINVGDLYIHIPIDLENLELFDATNDEVTRFMVQSGDLFFTRSSVVPSGIAHCNIYLSQKSETVVFDSHVIRCQPDRKKVNPSYLFRYCVASIARNYLVSHAKTGTMTTIDQGVLAKCPVILPPTLVEQEAIAEALRDTDVIIEALEQLVAKKRQIKQAAMQELLTGKRRLPEFSGEWKTKKLGEFVEFVSGKPLEKKVSPDGDYFVITLDSIDIDGNLKQEHKKSSYFDNSLQKGDIVIILSDLAHGYLLGLCDLIPEDNRYILNQRVGRLRCGDDYIPQFIRMQINRNQDFFRKRGQGTSQRHIYKRDIFDLSISLPLKDEQTAIAETLSDMDAEIAALEGKLSKARQVKQGMMQELLTGRVRLV